LIFSIDIDVVNLLGNWFYTGREFMGSMLDSSDGVLLHEWWSSFYPVFDSRL